MRSLRWCASLAATAGLAGSALFGLDSAAPAIAQTPTAASPPIASGPLSPDAAARTDVKGPPQDSGPGPMRQQCLGLVPPPYAYPRYPPFVCGDWRFGPVRLPHTGILGGILSGYHRFGNLTPVEFLNRWWDPTRDLGRGDWKYPPDDGFEHDVNGNVIAAPVTLHPGQLLDRFGNEFGSFLAPAGTKYGERALPPSNLNTEDPRYPYGYHLYRVDRDTTVCAGPQAPAFQQQGQGVQYVTSSAFCPTLPKNVSVSSLLRSGNLERAN